MGGVAVVAPHAVDLAGDEILAQLLDRGDLATWRERFALAPEPGLRRRIPSFWFGACPLPSPAFWLAAIAGLGEEIDWTMLPPRDSGIA